MGPLNTSGTEQGSGVTVLNDAQRQAKFRNLQDKSVPSAGTQPVFQSNDVGAELLGREFENLNQEVAREVADPVTRTKSTLEQRNVSPPALNEADNVINGELLGEHPTDPLNNFASIYSKNPQTAHMSGEVITATNKRQVGQQASVAPVQAQTSDANRLQNRAQPPFGNAYNNDDDKENVRTNTM